MVAHVLCSGLRNTGGDMRQVCYDPLPVSGTFCGLSLALSSNVKLLSRLPVAVGVKLTLTLQLSPGKRNGPVQLSVTFMKSPAFVPVRWIALIVKTAKPVFVSVTVCGGLLLPTGWLPNVRVAGLRVANATSPVPCKGTLCGLPSALSTTVTSPVRTPAPWGAKNTWIGHERPGGRVVTQDVLILKSPLGRILVMIRGALPVFLMVTSCQSLRAPTGSSGKSRLVGSMLTPAPVPVPSSGIVWELPGPSSVKVRPAARSPTTVGEKLTSTSQLFPGTIVALLHLSDVIAKSSALFRGSKADLQLGIETRTGALG